MRLTRTEAEEQVAVFAWRDLNLARWPELANLYAVPNFAAVGKRTRASGGWIAQRMREGMRPGVPDLCLAVGRGGYLGFYGEMKRRTARATKTRGVVFDKTKTKPEQDAWLKRLRAAGYYACVAWSAEEMQAEIERYLRLPPTVVVRPGVT